MLHTSLFQLMKLQSGSTTLNYTVWFTERVEKPTDCMNETYNHTYRLESHSCIHGNVMSLLDKGWLLVIQLVKGKGVVPKLQAHLVLRSMCGGARKSINFILQMDYDVRLNSNFQLLFY